MKLLFRSRVHYLSGWKDDYSECQSAHGLSSHADYSGSVSDRDLLMLMNLNGRERSLSAWKELFDFITPSLQLQQVYWPAQGELSLLELTLSE